MQKTLNKIISYAASIAEPDKIILFGSMATGNVNNFSDVDLLIISNNTSAKKEITSLIENYTNELSLKTDVLFYSEKEIQKEISTPDSFVAGILKAGKIVFSKCD